MSEKVIEASRKYVSVNKFREITGLSREDILKLIKENRIEFVETDVGHYKVRLPPESPEVAELNKTFARIEYKLDRVLRLFSMLAEA